MIKSLVTGAAGFIGSHLCERLLAEGHAVWGVDDLSAGRIENLDTAQQSANFCFAECGAAQVEAEGFDYVFHLAALADIVPSIRNPIQYHRANVNGTVALLGALRDSKKLKKFVYAASSSCYGAPAFTGRPTDETAPISCQYPYALTKNIAEQYVMHWAGVYKLPAISLRLFNVYGPRARTTGSYGAMFGVFLSQMANGLPITIVGDGQQTRDFTYVSDVCEAFLLAAKSSRRKDIFNIGSGGTYSINQIAALLGASERVHIPKRPGEPDTTFADITKARVLLGYSPKVSIEHGCWVMRSNIDAYKSAPLWTPESIKEQTKDWFSYLGEQ